MALVRRIASLRPRRRKRPYALSSSTSVTLIGVSAATAAGALSPSDSSSFTLTGVSATASAGTLAPNDSSSIILGGAATSALAGTPTAGGSTSVNLVGSASTSAAGSISASGRNTVAGAPIASAAAALASSVSYSPSSSTPLSITALLHFDGASGSTTFTDATGNHTFVPALSGPVLDTSQSKFGSSSLHLTSSLDRISGDGTIAWGTGDFTIDFWLKLDGTQAGQTNIFDLNYPSPFAVIYISSPGGPLRFYVNGDVIVGSTAVTVSTWHHIALTKQGSNHYLFLDGNLEGTWVNAANYGTAAAGFPFIGEGNSNSPVGWIDELRIVIGAAAWTSNFAPATVPYTVSGLGFSAVTAAGTLGAGLLSFPGTAAGTAAGALAQQVASGLTGVSQSTAAGVVSVQGTDTNISSIQGATAQSVAGVPDIQFSPGAAVQVLAGTLIPAVSVVVPGASVTSSAGVVDAAEQPTLFGSASASLAGQFFIIASGVTLAGAQATAPVSVLAFPAVQSPFANAPLVSGAGHLSVGSSQFDGVQLSNSAGLIASQVADTLLNAALVSAAGTTAQTIGSPVTGASVATAAGTPAEALTAPLIGTSTSAAAGLFVPTVSAISGAGVSVSAGFFGTPGTTGLTGVSVASNAGTMRGSIIASLTGNALASLAGSPMSGTTVALHGAALAGAAGNTSIFGQTVFAGSQASSAGGMFASAIKTGAVPGALISSAAGVLSQNNATNSNLLGTALAASAGSLVVPGVMNLVGVVGASRAGVMSGQLGVSITGGNAVTASGILIPFTSTGAVTLHLTGAGIAAAAGSTVGAVTRGVTGARATSLVGFPVAAETASIFAGASATNQAGTFKPAEQHTVAGSVSSTVAGIFTNPFSETLQGSSVASHAGMILAGQPLTGTSTTANASTFAANENAPIPGAHVTATGGAIVIHIIEVRQKKQLAAQRTLDVQLKAMRNSRVTLKASA